ncbi:MAG TPA: hypothetical protein VM029_03670 [Opitutaceae bacterium]|nr:hypothetical protein [Opitutaceae bacterium]
MTKISRQDNPSSASTFAAWCGVFSVFALLGYVFAKSYMRLGWDVGWRTSQFFFNYQDLGFVKRALVGSFLHPFPSLRRGDVFLVLSAMFVVAFVVLFTALFLRATRHVPPRGRLLLGALCAASPALFLRQGFDLGRYDVLGLIAVIVSLFAIERGRCWIAGAASAVALLAHEAYIVINFPLIVACALTTGAERPSTRQLCLLLVPPAIVTLLLAAFGLYEPGLAALEKYFAGDSRYLVAKGGSVDVDAIAVLTRGMAENVDYVARMFWEKRAWLHLPIIVAWGAIMTWFLHAFHRQNALRRGLLYYAAFTPVLLSAIASDYYRWVALAATNIFLVILIEAQRLGEGGTPAIIPRGWPVALLIASALLGPISNTKSFPLLFTVLDRFFPGKIPW